MDLQTIKWILTRHVARIWKKGRGGFFERVRQLQETLSRIFIALESDSQGLSENETDFLAEIGNSNVFSAPKKSFHQNRDGFFARNRKFKPKNRWSPKKKRYSLKLRRNFRPKLEIHIILPTESRQQLLNFGTQIPLGELFSVFLQKSASKAPKTCDFAYFTGQWGGSSPPPTLPTPGYATDSNNELVSQKSRRVNLLDYPSI